MKNYNTAKRHFEIVLKNHPSSNCLIVPNVDNVSITAAYEDNNYIGFEGISTTKHGYCRCCGDKITQLKQYKTTYTTLAVNNSKNVILKLRKKMYHCPRCKTSTIDLWRTYRNVFTNLYQGIAIIADRFHVVRQFMWAFSRTRVALAKSKGTSTNKNWKLLTKAKDKLSERGLEKLELLLASDPALKAAHTAKEMALEMLRGNDKQQYLKMLPELKKIIDDNNLIEFIDAYNSLLNWHDEILNMFDYPYSNGSMERTNRTIKQIKNICFGVKSLSRTLKLVQYRVN